MEIEINDQPIAFTLEDERTLGDVVRGLERWLEGSQLVLCSVRHSGRELLGSPPAEWADKPPSEVDRLEVTVQSAGELALANLKTMAEFLKLALASASDPAGRPELAGELASGFPHLAESIRRHFPDAFSEAELSLIALLENPLAVGAEGRERAEALLRRLQERVARRLEQLEQPLAASRRLADELEGCIAAISEVPILLQTGGDRQAIEAVVRFSDLSLSAIRLFARRTTDIDGKSPREFFGDLNRVLKELIEAFTCKDVVLIGDLMEYEIAPRLAAIRAALAEVS